MTRSQPKPPALRVFISHAELDAPIAADIRQLLIDACDKAIDVWCSTSRLSVEPGEQPFQRIHDELARADRVITLLTPRSYLRPWLMYESGFVAAAGGKRKVIPLLCFISQNNLPGPLGPYKSYVATDASSMNDLITGLAKATAVTKTEHALQVLANAFCEGMVSHGAAYSDATPADKPCEFLPMVDVSLRLQERLQSADVRHVEILTYTGEVDSDILSNPFKLSGAKRIEVYKRSLVADLLDQQRHNLRLVRDGNSVRRWGKFRKGLENARGLSRIEAPHEVRQFFYDAPPFRRAYIFDRREAIVSSYCVEQAPPRGGSVFKGMTADDAMRVTDATPLGRYILAELGNHLDGLQWSSRTYSEEMALLSGRTARSHVICLPVLDLRAVFFDVDGVLYDSLPSYVHAWQEAFSVIGVKCPERAVYEEEGRRGRETVERVAAEHGRSVTKDEVEAVYTRKKEVLDRLPLPPIMRGAHELVDAVHRAGLTIWAVTGSSRGDVPGRLAKDFEGQIESSHVVCGGDTQRGKPAPDPYQRAMAGAGAHVTECVVIENAPLGVESACRAGLLCLGVNTGPLDRGALEKVGACVEFEDCQRLAERWDGVVETLRPGPIASKK